MTPTSGHQTGGETGIITGSAFAPDAAVKIGDNPATNVVATPTLIHFTIPSGTIGTVDVTVTDLGGREQVLENGYTYDPFPPPVIREIYPIEGPIRRHGAILSAEITSATEVLSSLAGYRLNSWIVSHQPKFA